MRQDYHLSQKNKQTTLSYRPEIDGLRAIAVISVIIFHLNPDTISGGFVGVDIFFVISGFLLTSIILKEENASKFSLLHFWSRRIRRILPALVTMIATTLVVGLFFLYKTSHQEMGSQALYSLFSLANIQMWLLTRDYWGPQANDSYFLHTWTLSVEEQFYALLPLFFLLFFKYRRQALPKFALATVLTGYALFAINASERPNAAFYLLPFRIWELALGCSLALHQEIINKARQLLGAKNEMIGWIGFAMILSSLFVLNGKEGVSWTLVLPTLGTVLVVGFVFQKEQKIFRLLSHSVLVFIGKISYSLYLWHWPIIVFTRNRFEDLDDPVKLIIIFLFGWSSYLYVEKPCRYRTGIIPLIVLAFLSCTGLGCYLKFFDTGYDVSQFDNAVWAGKKYDATPNPKEWNTLTKNRFAGIEVLPRTEDNSINNDLGGITQNYGGEFNDLLLIGDSHSLMWAPVIDQIASDLNLTVSFMGRDHHNPFLYPTDEIEKSGNSNHLKYNQQILSALDRGVGLVVLAARWSFWHEVDISFTIRQITQRGSAVLLIQQPPELYFGNKNTKQYLSFIGLKPSDGEYGFIKMGNIENHALGSAKIESLANTFNDCALVHIEDLYSNEDGMTKVLFGRQILYIDDDHLSLRGAKISKERIKSSIVSFIPAKKRKGE